MSEIGDLQKLAAGNPKRAILKDPTGEGSPAVTAMRRQIEGIKDANTYRGRVTRAGDEMAGVVESAIMNVKLAERGARREQVETLAAALAARQSMSADAGHRDAAKALLVQILGA